jgi:hypothetical protein
MPFAVTRNERLILALLAFLLVVAVGIFLW